MKAIPSISAIGPAWLSLLLPMLLCLSPAAAQEVHDQEWVDQALERICDSSYQAQMPTDSEEEPPEQRPREIRAPRMLPNLTWKILLIVAAALIGFWLWTNFFDAKRETEEEAAGLEAALNGEMGDGLLPDADALARGGDYAAAIHTLLLHALLLLARRHGREWPRALTSREILRHTASDGRSTDGLADLVHRVEYHHFGLVPPTSADYDGCRDLFRRWQSATGKAAR